ncbi:xanthine dehydrogenase accessory protein XdhC [Labrenzia sp. 011]|uniref:xanthine dehydrogenase accessory protein XdhC n=1 Tax=Labrenzia sp. 011 TaxID=2171494 RepID=UPI000D50905D|nr:xanthine dehydrogenase accessory protein XdhC [Labrenzia sp. 011]PVB62797.1 xanthine dehydrogenase accessory protein XdhC [Labrenzia sp. 011]
MNIWGHIANSLKHGNACALVTVARAEGSTPRDAGARMVVGPQSAFHGTIGGGTLEYEAIRRAASAARSGKPAFVLQSVSLGPDLGQCCGGRAEIAIEVLTPHSLEMAEMLARREAEGTAFATVATVEPDGPLNRQIVEAVPDDIFSMEVDPVSSRRRLSERFGAIVRPLYLFGAGHVGRALVLALAPLPFDVTWIDSRAEQFPGPVPANVRKICVSDPAGALEQAPDGAFVLAMTHSHPLDEEIMARALLQQRFAYCGVIGSRTKRARFQKRLNSRGIDSSLISRMVCPVGISAIKSKHPAAIAAGIAVELLERDEAGHQQAAAGKGLAQNIPHGQ